MREIPLDIAVFCSGVLCYEFCLIYFCNNNNLTLDSDWDSSLGHDITFNEDNAPLPGPNAHMPTTPKPKGQQNIHGSIVAQIPDDN